MKNLLIAPLLAIVLSITASPSLQIIDNTATITGADFVQRDTPGEIIEGVAAVDDLLIVPETTGGPVSFSVGPDHKIAWVGTSALDPMFPQRTLLPVVLGQVEPAVDRTLAEVAQEVSDLLDTYRANALIEQDAKASLDAVIVKLQQAVAKQQARATAHAELNAKALEVIALENIE